MRRVIVGLVAMMVLAGVGHVEAAYQWSMPDGGNDHWYEMVLPENGPFVNWDQARIAAENEFFLGMRGHLVTVTTEAEHHFLEQKFATELNSPNNYPADTVWIGLTDRDEEGVFRWITGEPLSFVAWLPGEPNNAEAGWNLDGEDVVHYSRIGTQALLGWNDHPGVIDPEFIGGPYPGLRIGYITEFEPAAVPEPASIAVWSILGMAGIGCGWWRKRRIR